MRRVSPRIDRVVRSIMPSSTFAAYSVSGHDMKVPNPCFIGNLSDWCTSSQALGLEHPQLSWPIAAHEQLWWIHGRRALPEPRHERSEFQMTAEEVIRVLDE